ncbi:MAG: hypothetical protein LAP21_11455 [Acidobacteriia bacterium]|nr:hypothetical protein [Terriglobia bacterium]
MKQNVQPDTSQAQKTAAGPVRSQPASRHAPAPGGGLAQLAAMMNGSPRMQSLAQLKEAPRRGGRVRKLMDLSAEINPGLTAPNGDDGQAAQLREAGASVIQLELQPEALSELVATAGPALEQGGAKSPPRCVKQTYAAHDAVPGDHENAWMDRCLTKAGDKLMELDLRIRQALLANPSFIEHVTQMTDRIWTPPIAAAFRDGLMARIRPGGLTELQLGESIQVMGALPLTQWKTDEFLTLSKVEEAARSNPDLEALYGEHPAFVNAVRIRAFHTRFHPPLNLAIAPTPTAGARRARFNKKTDGYGVPRTTPELELLITQIGEMLRTQHLEQRELSKKQFNKDEVVFVPVGNVANASGEVLVNYARTSSYVPLADLTLEAAPQTGNLDPLNAVPLFPLTGPSPADVGQQALGDCYFLAALASIAKSKSAVIRDVVKDRGNGNYAVRFFSKQALPGKPPSYKPEWVGVNSEVYVNTQGKPVYAKGSTALWPAIVEKAYAVWKGRGSYEGISGGFSNDAFEQVLGVPAEKTDVSALHSVEGALGSGIYSKQALDLFRKTQHATNAGGVVALDTKEWGTGGTGESAGENTTQVPGLASSHAYSVFTTVGEPGVNKYLYVTVRNPWGHFGRGYSLSGFLSKSISGATEVEGGTFNLELSDLMRYASNVHFA